jgi:hypothetical protein
MRTIKRPLALAAVLTLAMSVNTMAQTSPQVPQPADGSVGWGDVGYGVGALFSNLLYLPCKLVYALGGSLVGGGAYLATAGNTQVSDTIFRSSLGGDYVITPDMLKGNAPLHFSGPTETVQTQTAAGGTPPVTAAGTAPAPPASWTAAPMGAGSAPNPASGVSQPIDGGAGSLTGVPPPPKPDSSIE